MILVDMEMPERCMECKAYVEDIHGRNSYCKLTNLKCAVGIAKDNCPIKSEIPNTEQEPCEDVVSRQTVKEQMIKYGFYAPDMTVTEFVEDCLPSVTPQPKIGLWIPVSESLPEDRREVLVTAYWHETYQVMIASYYGDDLWWCVPFNNCGEHMQRLKPKAWMPLPEPYKEESEGIKMKVIIDIPKNECERLRRDQGWTNLEYYRKLIKDAIDSNNVIDDENDKDINESWTW